HGAPVDQVLQQWQVGIIKWHGRTGLGAESGDRYQPGCEQRESRGPKLARHDGKLPGCAAGRDHDGVSSAPMMELRVVDERGGITESIHSVSVAVVGGDDRWLGGSGPDTETVFWRSTAKPFQLWPRVERGGNARLGRSSRHVARACASHNGEDIHLQVAAGWLAAAGLTDSTLACGGHPSLSPAVAESMIREGKPTTPLGSNCSGKHSAMLSLARLE